MNVQTPRVTNGTRFGTWKAKAKTSLQRRPLVYGALVIFFGLYYYRPEDFAIVDRVSEVARKRGLNNAQIALAWVLHQPGITAAIIGASKQHHLEDALKALTVKLDADELKYLSDLYKPRTVLANV